MNFDREEIGSDDRCEYDGDGHAYDDGDGHDNRRHDIDDSPHQLKLKVFRVFLQEMIESQERTRTEKRLLQCVCLGFPITDGLRTRVFLKNHSTSIVDVCAGQKSWHVTIWTEANIWCKSKQSFERKSKQSLECKSKQSFERKLEQSLESK